MTPTALDVLTVLALLVLAGMFAVSAIAVALGLAGLAAVTVARIARRVRSVWNGRPDDVDEQAARAAAMRRHPSALGPRGDLELLAAAGYDLDELEAAIDDALERINAGARFPQAVLTAYLEQARADAAELAATVAVPTDLLERPTVSDADTELLPRVLDVTTLEDGATVVEVVYPPRLPSTVIDNTGTSSADGPA